jgi:UPF0716 family protein affecting phage T7 exclusion
MEKSQGETTKTKMLEEKLLSLGGILVLINSILSNIVLFMNFFLPASQNSIAYIWINYFSKEIVRKKKYQLAKQNKVWFAEENIMEG